VAVILIAEAAVAAAAATAVAANLLTTPRTRERRMVSRLACHVACRAAHIVSIRQGIGKRKANRMRNGYGIRYAYAIWLPQMLRAAASIDYTVVRTVRAMAVAGAERGGQEVGGRPDVHV
jgi:hypothetical protein